MLGFRRVGHIEQNVRTVDYRLADYDLVIEGHGRHQGLGASLSEAILSPLKVTFTRSTASASDTLIVSDSFLRRPFR
ncbi:MAG: hypothetical protein ACLTTP_02415 [Alistipes ihumii]